MEILVRLGSNRMRETDASANWCEVKHPAEQHVSTPVPTSHAGKTWVSSLCVSPASEGENHGWAGFPVEDQEGKWVSRGWGLSRYISRMFRSCGGGSLLFFSSLSKGTATGLLGPGSRAQHGGSGSGRRCARMLGGQRPLVPERPRPRRLRQQRPPPAPALTAPAGVRVAPEPSSLFFTNASSSRAARGAALPRIQPRFLSSSGLFAVGNTGTNRFSFWGLSSFAGVAGFRFGMGF